MKKTIVNITSESKKTQVFENVLGDIKKIFIKSKGVPNDVSLTFKTNENEIIYKVKLDNEIVLIYPYNFIDVQGRGVEYYSEGDIFIEVEGLENDDMIEQITLFYK